MAITELNPTKFAHLELCPPLPEPVVPQEHGTAVPVEVRLSEDPPDPRRERGRARGDAAVVGSIFSFIAGAVLPTFCRRLRGRAARGPGTGQRTAIAQVPSPAEWQPPFLGLPAAVIESIFYFLGLRDKQALTVSCKTFSRQFRELYQRRCKLLLDADREAQLFGRFGINCSGDVAPSHAQMEAMVSRINLIMESTNEVLVNFPESPAFRYTANGLVFLRHPKRLREVLETAYRCSLYKVFAPFANVVAGISPAEAAQSIRGWLETPGALGVTRISLQGARLACLPSEIGRLKKLQALDLSQNLLGSVPGELWHLPALYELLLGDNKIKEAPAGKGQQAKSEIGWLSQLKFSAVRDKFWPSGPFLTLNLSNNQLSTIFPELWQLAARPRNLSLCNNAIKEIPARIGQLECLRELRLDQNQLKELPAEIGQLGGLHELSLSGNQLATLCPEICHLTRLQELKLDNNCLKELPDGVWQLANLRTLLLGQNQLKELPAGVWQLAQLKELSLSGNQLATLCLEVCRLTKLEKLNLDNNRLKELPAGIGRLVNLQVLTLGQNQLNELPAEMWQLAQLKELSLCGNQLSVLRPALWQLTTLEKLSAANNAIRELPAGIGRLANLQVLNLEQNQIEVLPDELGQLFRLSELCLSSNQIATFQIELWHFPSLKRIGLSHNPIEGRFEQANRAVGPQGEPA